MASIRSVWSGSITFGMVSIPVKLYTATEDKSIHFKQIHEECGTPIKQLLSCPVCEKDIDRGVTGKGYDVGGGSILKMEDSDFLNLPLASVKAVDVTAFVPADTVPVIAIDKAYYVKPEQIGLKPFALLWQALADGELNLVAVAKVALRSGRESVCTLRRHGRLLLLQTILWPDEIRPTEELEEMVEPITFDMTELELARQLVAAMTQDDGQAVLAEQKDSYREALLDVIQAKLDGRELPTPVTAAAKPAANLIESLRESVEAAKKARSA